VKKSSKVLQKKKMINDSFQLTKDVEQKALEEKYNKLETLKKEIMGM